MNKENQPLLNNIVYLAIGTNIGDKENNISSSLYLLNNHKDIHIVQTSHMYLNPPQEGVIGDDFLNGALKIITKLNPDELLIECKKIEKTLGRKTDHEKYAIDINAEPKAQYMPRTIDLDILFYNEEMVISNDLTVPHPRLHKRDFVLKPLIEIAADLIHPLLKKTIKELHDELFLAEACIKRTSS